MIGPVEGGMDTNRNQDRELWGGMVRGDGREGREMRNGKEVQERFGCRDWRDLWEGWCYNISGSFRTTTITLTLLAPRRGLDSSSGTAQRMISRARRQYADDYATM